MMTTPRHYQLHRPKAYSYIRFSTVGQKFGDSMRRQTELAYSYAVANNLDLQDLTIEDLGVSAYKGSNSLDGELGNFIDAVRRGEIDNNSWLLVESVDRLSRQEPEDSLALFIAIINLGITIVTLQDEQVYCKGDMGFTKLLMLLVKAQTAHEESDKKGKRSKANWEHKRALMESGKKIKPAQCPSWLTWDKDKHDFAVKPEAVKTLRRIFELSIAGYGAESIARLLNTEGVPMFNGSPAKWLKSSINRIQKDRKVIGEHQPKERLSKTQRKPIGAPIENYYPQVIKTEDFHEAARIRKSKRKGESNGIRNNKLRNIFAGLLRCGHCGAMLQVMQKSNRKRVEQYGEDNRLECPARRDLLCNSVSLKYDTFERMLCSAISHLPSIMDSHLAKAAEINSVTKAISAAKLQLDDLSDQADRVLDLLIERDGNATLTARFDSIEKNKKELTDQLNALEQKHRDLQSAKNYSAQAAEMFSQVNSEDAISSTLWRQRFNTQLKRILKSIVVYISKDGVVLWAVDKSEKKIMSLTSGRRSRFAAGEADMKGDYYDQLLATDDQHPDNVANGVLIYMRTPKGGNIEYIPDSKELIPSETTCLDYFYWLESEVHKFIFDGSRKEQPTVLEYFEWNKRKMLKWGDSDEAIEISRIDMTKALAKCGVVWLK
ncbi:recombinase family protein [Vibrio parahaemolyticus]|nr:recombinase family protein [Vibrio parahaemolyticus]